MIELKINNIPISIEEGSTILQAAHKAGVEIPTLCYLKEINQIGACRICVVEVKNARGLVAACAYPVAQGMEVFTNTKHVIEARKANLELILSDHNRDCLSCVASGSCDLQRLAQFYGCDSSKYTGSTNKYAIDDSSEWMVRDNNKCVLCRKCSAVCSKVQEVAVIGANDRGFDTHIGCAFDTDIKDNPCVACGQCINVCPTGALSEKQEIDNVIDAINDSHKHVVVGTAPAVRVALGEEFGLPYGTDVEGKMVSALKRLGFDKVFDVNLTADLTIIEEGHELLGRITNGGALPMITSCSPGWIRYIEQYYPHLLKHVSSCKSPQQMFGAIIKSYYAHKNGLDPKDIYVVTIMPCVAKKFEKTREYQAASGYPDIDAVLTTRELARLIRKAGIVFTKLPDQEFDAPLGVASTAGLIFGTSGGVMEAALRTVADKLGEPLKKIELKDVRARSGIKEAKYSLQGKTLKVCTSSGIKNAKTILDKIDKGQCDYTFIEIMTCPGGCVNGGGQPKIPCDDMNFDDVIAKRAAAIYAKDSKSSLRKSHENPVILAVYKDFLGAPNSERAHHILHTKYTKRNKYNL